MKKNNHKILIDAHIHFHGCYDKATFLNSAQNNFKKIALKRNIENFQSILFLTESYGDNFFNELFETAKNGNKLSKWTLSLTENENTIKISHENGFDLFIIAGKQIVTKENLEVLALGLKDDYRDGKSIEDVLEEVADLNILSVIPWGVGKWFSRRKQIIENLVMQTKSNNIYLGDNGNRPFFWPKPKLFQIAEGKGILNLPGSDPLPFRREVYKPGSFGFIIEEVLNEEKPFDSITEIISSTKIQFKTFGKLEGLINFLKNQVAMQIVKRNR